MGWMQPTCRFMLHPFNRDYLNGVAARMRVVRSTRRGLGLALSVMTTASTHAIYVRLSHIVIVKTRDVVALVLCERQQP
jgi:hypothetical protein